VATWTRPIPDYDDPGKIEKGCGDVVREVLAIRQFGFKF